MSLRRSDRAQGGTRTDFRLLDARVNGIMYGDGKRNQSGRDEAFTAAFGAARFPLRANRPDGRRTPLFKGPERAPLPVRAFPFPHDANRSYNGAVKSRRTEAMKIATEEALKSILALDDELSPERISVALEILRNRPPDLSGLTRVIRFKDVAAMLGVSRDTVDGYVRRGHLTAVRGSGHAALGISSKSYEAFTVGRSKTLDAKRAAKHPPKPKSDRREQKKREQEVLVLKVSRALALPEVATRAEVCAAMEAYRLKHPSVSNNVLCKATGILRTTYANYRNRNAGESAAHKVRRRECVAALEALFPDKAARLNVHVVRTVLLRERGIGYCVRTLEDILAKAGYQDVTRSFKPPRDWKPKVEKPKSEDQILREELALPPHATLDQRIRAVYLIHHARPEVSCSRLCRLARVKQSTYAMRISRHQSPHTSAQANQLKALRYIASLVLDKTKPVSVADLYRKTNLLAGIPIGLRVLRRTLKEAGYRTLTYGEGCPLLTFEDYAHAHARAKNRLIWPRNGR